ncbi:MAG: metal-dependent transcriptional regulator [Lachnospiraceae bacterium]|jgi:DtxR family Mn-dependent transcriptional regulator|nr:metal-dependent transcriptional regulator [Lachnospiraceae bacterium]
MRRTEENNGTQKTTEDYLEAILEIYQDQGYVRSIDVAEHLEVSKPSVTYTTKRLKEKNYITTDHAGMLVLTEEGKAIAERTLDRHHTLTKLLESVGVDHNQAQIDACKVEHDLSEESFQAIKKLVKGSQAKTAQA